jgi:hypothetical protein
MGWLLDGSLGWAVGWQACWWIGWLVTKKTSNGLVLADWWGWVGQWSVGGLLCD